MADIFAVEGVENGVGIRLLGYAWLGVQPPNVGPYVDYVYAVYGSYMTIAAVANLPTASDHSAVSFLANEIKARQEP